MGCNRGAIGRNGLRRALAARASAPGYSDVEQVSDITAELAGLVQAGNHAGGGDQGNDQPGLPFDNGLRADRVGAVRMAPGVRADGGQDTLEGGRVA